MIFFKDLNFNNCPKNLVSHYLCFRQYPNRYNERVSSSSSARAYALSGYERETWIDPARNIADVVASDREPKTSRLEAKELETAVLFETAGGLGAKLNNTHIMGGERVKELDFFVASIETPVLIIR